MKTFSGFFIVFCLVIMLFCHQFFFGCFRSRHHINISFGVWIETSIKVPMKTDKTDFPVMASDIPLNCIIYNTTAIVCDLVSRYRIKRKFKLKYEDDGEIFVFFLNPLSVLNGTSLSKTQAVIDVHSLSWKMMIIKSCFYIETYFFLLDWRTLVLFYAKLKHEWKWHLWETTRQFAFEIC